MELAPRNEAARSAPDPAGQPSKAAAPLRARRPLPPLSSRAATLLRFAVVGWTAVAVIHGVQIASGENVAFNAGLLVLALLLAVGSFWELRRRSDPARTAGWGSRS